MQTELTAVEGVGLTRFNGSLGSGARWGFDPGESSSLRRQ